MSRGARLSIVLALFSAVVGVVVFAAMAYVRSSPPTIDLAADHAPGKPVDLTLQTVGAIGTGVHPDWVSYLTRLPDGKWVHSTLWNLPAHTVINVTIYQFDTGSPLRNQQLGQVSGTQGGEASVNGKLVSVVDSNVGNGVGHTFSIPALGVNVPLPGVNGSAKTFCNVAAPCPLSALHNVVKFSFTTPGPGQYHWQCFVPCAAGFLDGNGGPMGTVGYMGGFLKVVA